MGEMGFMTAIARQRIWDRRMSIHDNIRQPYIIIDGYLTTSHQHLDLNGDALITDCANVPPRNIMGHQHRREIAQREDSYSNLSSAGSNILGI